MVYACTCCQDHLLSQPVESIVFKKQSKRPFQQVAADFCYHASKFYVIVVDCYLGWPTIIPMGRDIRAKHLIAGLRALFTQTAIPDVFWSDRGPQFTSTEFKSFAHQWGFCHQTSTPHYPQSNGRAEAAVVKSMNKIISGAGEPLRQPRLWPGQYLKPMLASWLSFQP